jgi:valyl-tRNA synthetase
MDKAYDHQKFESQIYKMWEEAGAFKPSEAKKTFCIIMPPPNANDNLHIGHARFVTIEDVLIRYHRMKGDATLWLPGADHAGIETQFVFEKKLKEKGQSRFDYTSREKLYEDIWNYVQENRINMENQLRSLGASCDWSRNKFTLDPSIIKIVYKTFKKLNDDRLLYRGEKLVNYCTRCGTAYSELEVDHVEKESEFFTLDYGTIKIATTRPETIFADAAIAVNPNDKQYKHLIGKIAVIPIINKEIPIIEDEAVEIGLGTNALKVTPAHDFTDWEIGERHNLQRVQIIGTDGRMKKLDYPEYKQFEGLFVNEARRMVVEELKRSNKLIEIAKKTSVVGVCYRCKNIIEPLPYEQWFIKVEKLAKAAKTAVLDGKTKFAAEKFEKIYNHWLDNLKDWNISRQIVWGIQIPAWRCLKCNEWTITDGEIPSRCSSCTSTELRRDEDTFDTWFSSGQWPFATLQTTSQGDFNRFYPTSVMETAYDILPFWVMRMMMLGIYVTGKVPFENVLIHGLVRDKNGQKISKSKGNVINPLEMTGKYGTDALRVALVWGALVDNDISLSEDNIRGQKFFANKIWNAARFIISDPPKKMTEEIENKEFSKKMNEIINKVNKSLDKYHLGQAVEDIYENFWHWFCDICIEQAKKGELSKADLVHGLINFLKLLHPFMPFVTEAVWQEMRKVPELGMWSEMLITAKWPE